MKWEKEKQKQTYESNELMWKQFNEIATEFCNEETKKKHDFTDWT